MHDDTQKEAFREGKRVGLAIAAVAASAVAFVSLLGIEKAILAITLAILAIRGTAPRSRVRRLASVALGIAMVYVLTFVVVMALFREKLYELIHLLQQMS